MGPSAETTQPPSEDPGELDMTFHGLNNGRSRYIQTILLGRSEIVEFLTLFSIPIPTALPFRIDIPRGLPFPNFLYRVYTPTTSMPPCIRTSDTRTQIKKLYPDAPKVDKVLPTHTIWALQLAPGRSIAETSHGIHKFMERTNIGFCGRCYFRGTTRWDLERAVAKFGPADIEPTDLGPGLYTTEHLGLAVAYAGHEQGVVWVFADAVSCTWGLKAETLLGKEWEWVAGGRGGRPGKDNEDLLLGTVSDDRGPAGMQGCVDGKVNVVPMGSLGEWMCWRTQKAWKILGKCLVALVYLEDSVEMEYEGWAPAG